MLPVMYAHIVPYTILWSTHREQLTDIMVTENYCGCVYAINLESNYNANKIYPEVSTGGA